MFQPSSDAYRPASRYLSRLLLPLFLSACSLWAHQDRLSRETLEDFFPEAENFVTRKKTLTPAESLRVETLSGDALHEVDKELLVYVALGIDTKTKRYRPIGAVLMVDAEGRTGLIDMIVAFNLDGSVRGVMISNNQDDPRLNSEQFLKQFAGKSPSDSWDVGNDFRLVGDPLSAKAVVLAVRRGMYLLQTVLGK